MTHDSTLSRAHPAFEHEESFFNCGQDVCECASHKLRVHRIVPKLPARPNGPSQPALYRRRALVFGTQHDRFYKIILFFMKFKYLMVRSRTCQLHPAVRTVVSIFGIASALPARSFCGMGKRPNAP